MGYTALRINPGDPGIQQKGHAVILMLMDLYPTETAVAVLVQALTSMSVALIKAGSDTADLNRVQMLDMLDELRRHVIAATDDAVAEATTHGAQGSRS